MALQDDIRDLVAAGRLPRQWTVADLQGEPDLSDVYAEAYVATQPANRSKPAPGMDHLGTGNHVVKGQTALFLRVGKRDGALLFQLADAAPAATGDAPFPQNLAPAAPDEEAVDDLSEPRDEGLAFTSVTESNNWIEEGDHYLSSDDAIGALIDDMKGLLGDGPPIAHSYRHRRPAYEWQCLGLLDAAARYRFPVKNYGIFHALIGAPPRDTLDANGKVLINLQTTLRGARKAGNSPLAVQTAIDILEWGGTNRGGYNSAAVNAANARPGGFLGYLDLCERSFGYGTRINLAPFIGSGHGIRSNAGFSKIYALAFDKFIIYDSRVAAALGLIVVRCLAVRGYFNIPVPTSVAFRAYNDGLGTTHRNPDSNSFNLTGFIPATGSNDLEHLKWNVRANALMTHVLGGSAFETAVLSDPKRFPVPALRALEAALFMIGYDLGGNWPHRI